MSKRKLRAKFPLGLTGLDHFWHWLVGGLALACLLLSLLLLSANAAWAGDRSCGTCPAPTNPEPAPYSAPASGGSDSSDTARNFAITALVIAGIACAVQWDDCKALFAGTPPPKDDGASMVPAAANPQQYGIDTTVTLQ